MVTINEAREMANLPKVGKLGDFTGRYVCWIYSSYH